MSSVTGQLKNLTGNGGEIEGMTCSKEPQGGIEPEATAVRTQPLYMRAPALPTEQTGRPILRSFNICLPQMNGLNIHLHNIFTLMLAHADVMCI